MIDEEDLLGFVAPYYYAKDIMHNLSHINRVIRAARNLMENYIDQVDVDIILLGCYFHGLIYSHEELIREYLQSHHVLPELINKVIQVSWESQRDQVPSCLEGQIVHDAHLLEGGKTGAIRGQRLEQTVQYAEKNLVGKSLCYLPESQRVFAEQESFTIRFLEDLKASL